MNDTKSAFIRGYRWGEEHGEELTRREVMERFPDFDEHEVDAFIQGHLDGIEGDTYRLTMMTRAPKKNPSAHTLRKWLREGFILRGGHGSFYVEEDEPVYVAVAYNVRDYGPHDAWIDVTQHGYESEDDAIVGADDGLTNWILDNIDRKYLEELKSEFGDDWMEVLRETIDVRVWTLTPLEAVEQLRGTPAEKFVEWE